MGIASLLPLCAHVMSLAVPASFQNDTSRLLLDHLSCFIIDTRAVPFNNAHSFRGVKNLGHPSC